MGTHPPRCSCLLCLSLVSTRNASPDKTSSKKCHWLCVAAALRSLHLASTTHAPRDARTCRLGFSHHLPPTIGVADAFTFEHAHHQFRRVLSRLAITIAREPMFGICVRSRRTHSASERSFDFVQWPVGSGRSRMLRHSLSLAWCPRCSMDRNLA